VASILRPNRTECAEDEKDDTHVAESAVRILKQASLFAKSINFSRHSPIQIKEVLLKLLNFLS
jgi:hypothetical protein